MGAPLRLRVPLRMSGWTGAGRVGRISALAGAVRCRGADGLAAGFRRCRGRRGMRVDRGARSAPSGGEGREGVRGNRGNGLWGFPGFPRCLQFPCPGGSARYSRPVPCAFPVHLRGRICRCFRGEAGGVWGTWNRGRVFPGGGGGSGFPSAFPDWSSLLSVYSQSRDAVFPTSPSCSLRGSDRIRRNQDTLCCSRWSACSRPCWTASTS